MLLDAAFARPRTFTRLYKKANVTHVVFDYNLPPQCSDEEIYHLAVKEDRFVVTINYQDFKKLLKKGKPGIIGIPSELSNQEIDREVCQFLSMKNPDDYVGIATKINE